jgi:hypothetical protein
VFLEVHEDIDEGIPNLAWARQSTAIPSIPPKWPAAPDRAVHSPSKANGQPAHASRERAPVRRFDEEMQMIRLHRKMDDAKCARRGLRERSDNGLERPRRAQVRPPTTGAKRHVHWVRSAVSGTSAMRRRRPRAGPLSTRPRTPPAPRGGELERQLGETFAHLD